MKNSIIVLLVASIITSCGVNKKIYNTEFDFQSAVAYFELVADIKKGNPISDTNWQNFLSLEGNAKYIKTNNIPKRVTNTIRNTIQTVYHPDSSQVLSQNIDKDLLLEIRNRYKVNEQSYKTHLDWMQRNSFGLQDNIIALARAYLPERMHKLDSFPKIFVHALWESSASDNELFLDILVSYDFDKKRMGSMAAHELHHFMRTRILNSVKKEVDSTDSGMIWALENILNEGIADLIDKTPMVYEGSDWWLNEYYLPILTNAPKIIDSLNTYIEREASGIHFSEFEYRQLFLNSVGHIPGFYMAKKIKDNGKLNELIENADNPFYFILLYNEASKLDNEDLGILSDDSIAYIKYLQRKYAN